MKSELGIVLGNCVHVRVKDKLARVREPWLTGNVEALVWKMEAYHRHKQLGTSNFPEEYVGILLI